MVSRPVDRYEIYLVALDPTVGSEIQKTRLCLIVSPDDMNHHIDGRRCSHDDQRPRLSHARPVRFRG